MARRKDQRAVAAHDDGADGQFHGEPVLWYEVAEDSYQAAPRRDAGTVLRTLALIAVAIGLAGLTAAACVLSYSSIHALALQAGVSAPLARIYPLIFDAMLAAAGCAVLALRGAGLPSRIYAWFCLIVLLGGLAAGSALHAARIGIPGRPADIAAAVIPFALVLMGFSLLLVMLRHARLRRLALRSGQAGQAGQAAQGAADEHGDQAGWADPVAGVMYEAPPALPAADPGAPASTGPVAAVAAAADAGPAPETGQAQDCDPDSSAEPAAESAPAAGDQPAAAGRPGVRQADLQLRARIPRPTPAEGGASQATTEHAPPARHPTPFMPPVGAPAATEPQADQRQAPRFLRGRKSSATTTSPAIARPEAPAQADQPATPSKASPADQASPSARAAQPGQGGPAADDDESGSTGLRDGADQGGEDENEPETAGGSASSTETGSGTEPGNARAKAPGRAGANLSAAPTQAGGKGQSSQKPPAFERPHSTPTPPKD